MTRFVILAVPRTGSNLLCTLLNSHPRILCHHEVFNPQGIFTALGHRVHGRALASLEERDRDPLGFLDRVWETGVGQDCVGFKWTRGQNEQVFEAVLSDAGVKKIVLRRRNRIKTFVSELIAKVTQQWEVYSPNELMLPRPRVNVDSQKLREYIASNEQFYAQLSRDLLRGNQAYLDVQYESLFSQKIQSQMLEFLGVSADLPLTPASVKQNSMDLRDLVENYTELVACLDDRRLVTELQDLGL